MMRLGGLVAPVILVAMLATGCGDMSDWWPPATRAPVPDAQAHLDTPTDSEWLARHGQDFVARGGYLYEQYCAACHGPNGIGRTAYFPSLRANPFVAAAPESALRIVLHGRGLMPPFRHQLSDEDIAAVITFVRTAWNNEEDLISPEVVQTLRWNP
jgi:mono/diheme cytochrome c family protein